MVKQTSPRASRAETRQRITRQLRVAHGTSANLAGRDTGWTGGGEYDRLSAGELGIFNRSHYEEVVAVRVHPEWLDRQKLPRGDRGPAFWSARYDDINAWERDLDLNGDVDRMGAVVRASRHHKHVMQAMAAALIVDTIGALDLRWPTTSDEARDANAKARPELEAEAD